MGTGQSFAKWLKPAGCLLFLGLFIAVTVILFTDRGTPVEGYSAPESSEYYAQHLDELAAELEENLLPRFEGIEAHCRVQDGAVVVTVPEDELFTVLSGVIYYYDQELFEFVAE